MPESHPMTIARRIAEYAAELTFDDLSEATVKEVCRRWYDSAGCALGAWDAPPAVIARRLGSRVTGSPGAKFPGSGSHASSPELAAFAAGVLFRYLDCNDTYLSLEPAHPSDNIAAVIAAAQVAGASGKDAVVSTVLAYEIQCRLCDAASIRAHGWDHVTYGAISTAAAAGKLLGLDADRIEQAINLAGTPNITLRQTRAGELSEWKGCAFANASRNGVFAALLAAEGLNGPAPLFEGEMGFFKQVSCEFELPPLAARPDDFMILKTSIKFWPAEYHSQSAIHAALELRPDIGSIDRIAKIDIHSFDAAVDIIGKDPEKWKPRTRETADHSLPYCTAVALADGDVTLASFDEAHLNDPALRELVQKIAIHRDAGLTARYPAGIPNRLTVTLTDGSQVVAENEFPRGHDRNPMTDDELRAKVEKLATGRMDADALEELRNTSFELPELENIDRWLEAFPAAE